MKLRYASTLDELKWWIICSNLTSQRKAPHVFLFMSTCADHGTGPLGKRMIGQLPGRIKRLFWCLFIRTLLILQQKCYRIFEIQNSLSLATTRSLECENYQVQICDFLDTYRQGLSRTSFTLHDFDGREQRAFRDMPPNKWASRPWSVEMFWVFQL